MIYGSVCSGIEAASVAWEPLGWIPAWFSEIDEFPSQVLQYHYPQVTNLGDMTKIYDNPTFKNTSIDLLVGGTPCQSFSQAGKRLGLEDARGNLALHFLRIAKEKRPRWVIWENVSGVLSSGDGEDFATILQTMVESGYGICYRMLDSRFFGLPQNRRRVFVVGHSGGDWRRAAAVLFERQTPSDDVTGGDHAEGRIPVCTVRNAGNANARGVVVAEIISEAGGSDGKGLGYDGKNLRRLTPTEEERRMGFSGTWTNIPNAVDSKRYKAIGNSMAVPVMRWIGEGIQTVDQIPQGGIMAKYTPEQKNEVSSLIAAGKGNKEITKLTGVHSGTVSVVRRKTNLNNIPQQTEVTFDSLVQEIKTLELSLQAKKKELKQLL